MSSRKGDWVAVAFSEWDVGKERRATPPNNVPSVRQIKAERK
jgi:hypothetical protein